MMSEHNDKTEKILALITDVIKENETSPSEAESATVDSSTNTGTQLLIFVQLLEHLAKSALRMNKSESVVAAFEPDDLTRFSLVLTDAAAKLFDFYRNAIKQMPSESIERLLIKLKVSKTLFAAELEADAKDIRAYVIDIADMQKQKLDAEIELGKKIAEFDRMCQRLKDLEDTLQIYAASSHRTLNNLPRRLNEAAAKMEAIEKLLGEVDEEINQILEKHQRNSNVMTIIEA